MSKTLVKTMPCPPAVDCLAEGSYRRVFTTTDPKLVRKCMWEDYCNDNRKEFDNYDCLPQDDFFKIPRCWLADDDSGDLIAERIYGEHPLIECDEGACEGLGMCADECVLLQAENFWSHKIIDIHSGNLIVDSTGVIWLIDYAL